MDEEESMESEQPSPHDLFIEQLRKYHDNESAVITMHTI